MKKLQILIFFILFQPIQLASEENNISIVCKVTEISTRKTEDHEFDPEIAKSSISYIFKQELTDVERKEIDWSVQPPKLPKNNAEKTLSWVVFANGEKFIPTNLYQINSDRSYRQELIFVYVDDITIGYSFERQSYKNKNASVDSYKKITININRLSGLLEGEEIIMFKGNASSDVLRTISNGTCSKASKKF